MGVKVGGADSGLPPRLKIGREKYVACVLQVMKKDEFERPTECRLWYDEDKIPLKGGEEFLIVYAKADCVAPKSPVGQA